MMISDPDIPKNSEKIELEFLTPTKKTPGAAGTPLIFVGRGM